MAGAADRALLAFWDGALVSAVSFELFEEGLEVGGAAAVGIER